MKKEIPITSSVFVTPPPPPDPISVYVVPSLVNCHASVDSFHLISTSGDVPLSTLKDAFDDGDPASALFSNSVDPVKERLVPVAAPISGVVNDGEISFAYPDL